MYYSIIHNSKRLFDIHQHNDVDDANEYIRKEMPKFAKRGCAEDKSKSFDLYKNTDAIWHMYHDLPVTDDFWVDEGDHDMHGVVVHTTKDMKWAYIHFGQFDGDGFPCDVQFFKKRENAIHRKNIEYKKVLKECIEGQEEDDKLYGVKNFRPLNHQEEDECSAISWDDGCGGTVEVHLVMEIN